MVSCGIPIGLSQKLRCKLIRSVDGYEWEREYVIYIYHSMV